MHQKFWIRILAHFFFDVFDLNRYGLIIWYFDRYNGYDRARTVLWSDGQMERPVRLDCIRQKILWIYQVR